MGTQLVASDQEREIFQFIASPKEWKILSESGQVTLENKHCYNSTNVGDEVLVFGPQGKPLGCRIIDLNPPNPQNQRRFDSSVTVAVCAL